MDLRLSGGIDDSVPLRSRISRGAKLFRALGLEGLIAERKLLKRDGMLDLRSETDGGGNAKVVPSVRVELGV